MKPVLVIIFFVIYSVICTPIIYNGGIVDIKENKMLLEDDPPKYIIKREVQNDNNENEIIATADSNYVYRPLFTYRRIEHSKRRITMYNSFLG